MKSWAAEREIPPYLYIYLKIAYHLSEEAQKRHKEFALSPIFQHELFDFQQNAVKIVARHLNNDKRRGAMIGDVVGLGKTITSLCCSKNLRNYVCRNYTYNLSCQFAGDVAKIHCQIRPQSRSLFNVKTHRY